MLTSENFTVKLAKANLAGKNDIANFVKTGVDNTLKNVTSINNELNELSRKVKALSKKKKKSKDLMKKFSIFNEAKYFSSGIFQNYLVFILAKR